MVSVVWVVGWAALAAAEDKPLPPVAAEFVYPQAQRLDAQVIAGGAAVTLATADDLATVAAWYAGRRKFGARADQVGPGRAGVVSGGDRRAAVADDSVAAGGPPLAPRPVQVQTWAYLEKGYGVFIALSRAADEKHTHIVITYLEL